MLRTSKRVVLAGVLAGGLSVFASAVMAAEAAELGKSQPQSVDLSAAPGFHVYVFHKDGVKYIQVNDVSGNILGAVATANGQFIRLPMGTALLSTPQHPIVESTSLSVPSITIYNDGEAKITASAAKKGFIISITRIPGLSTSLTEGGLCGNCGIHLQQQ